MDLNKDFISTPMMDLFFQQEMDSGGSYNLTLEQAMQTDLTKIFFKDLEFRCKTTKENEKRPQRNIILDIWGQTGSGKSEVALFIANNILSMNNTKFDVNKVIHFTFDTLNEHLENADEGDIFLIDEQEETSRFGVGSFRQIAEIRDTERVVRAKNISFLWVSPDKVFGHNPHYSIKALRVNMQEELNLSLIYDNNEQPRGFIVTPRINDKIVLEEYSKRKNEFIDKFLNRDYKAILEKLEKYYNEVIVIPNYIKFKNDEKRLKLRLKYPNLTMTEIEEIFNYVSMKIKEEGLIEKEKQKKS